MGTPKTHPNGLKLKTFSLIILILIISLITFFPSSSGNSKQPINNYIHDDGVSKIHLLEFFLFFIFGADGSDSTEESRKINTNGDVKKQKTMMMALGSRPPGCFHKCLGCNPCKATLVITPHLKASSSSFQQKDEGYYLLSWKCKCGNKLFQP